MTHDPGEPLAPPGLVHDGSTGLDVTDSSSRDLHPTHGGRFVMTRVGAVDDPSYDVNIYLPEGERLDTRLCWTDGQPVIEPTLTDAWAQDQVIKLARVLRRTPRASLTRWRGR